MRERRTAPRVKVNLRARWEGAANRLEADVTDLSSSGCFVLSGGTVESKELLRLEIYLFPEEPPVYFWAEVVDVAPEIGFAVRFTSMEDEDQKRLSDFLAEALNRENV